MYFWIHGLIEVTDTVSKKNMRIYNESEWMRTLVHYTENIYLIGPLDLVFRLVFLNIKINFFLKGGSVPNDW